MSQPAADMVPHCDVVTINAPLHPETEGLFDDEDTGAHSYAVRG